LYERRICLLRDKMNEFDALLMASSMNIGYFTGFFPGFQSLLFVPRDDEVVLFLSRADASLAEETCRFRVEVVGKEGYVEKLKVLLKEDVKKVGVEESLEAGMFSRLKREFPSVSFDFFGGLWDIRSVKSDEEIKAIRKSIEIAEAGLRAAVESISVGVRECDVAAEAEYEMRRLGAESFPFETIVASGSRGASPHATCSKRKIRRGDAVVIDLGARYEHYCSDITRTVIVGRNDKMEKALSLVIKAQEAALSMVKSEVSCSELDLAARKVLEREGYEKYFLHSLGHGIGLEVHEPPSISSTNKANIREKMVFTIEPGVYMHGVGGVRVEDTVVTEKKKGKVLTKLPKEFFV